MFPKYSTFVSTFIISILSDVKFGKSTPSIESFVKVVKPSCVILSKITKIFVSLSSNIVWTLTEDPALVSSASKFSPLTIGLFG